jgi:hypothetical protein
VPFVSDDVHTVWDPGYLRTEKWYLREILDLEFGLLDELKSQRNQMLDILREISAETNDSRKADILLQYIQFAPQDVCEEFWSALKKTSQQHIVNYIMTKGGPFFLQMHLIYVVSSAC